MESGLIKYLAVCVPSQFFSLCLESIADEREKDCSGLPQLLQNWAVLFQEYEILIKPLRLPIGSPSARKGVVSHSRPPSHGDEPTPIFFLNDIRLGILYLLPLGCSSENQYILNVSGEVNFSSVEVQLARWCIARVKKCIWIAWLLIWILFTAYSTFYIVGLILSMQIPFVGFQPIRTSEHMAAAGKSRLFCLHIHTSRKDKTNAFFLLNTSSWLLLFSCFKLFISIIDLLNASN